MDLVNPIGICCTRTTGASKFSGNLGITDCKDFGPPVELAIATICFPETAAPFFFTNSTIFFVF